MHFGENDYIINIITREHTKIGIIPGDNEGWARVNKETIKHVSLIRQMSALKEARIGEKCPISGAYVSLLFFLLGCELGRTSKASQEQGVVDPQGSRDM